MRSNQVKLDEALAAFLQQQEEEARTIAMIADEAMATEWQNMEDYSLISGSDDETIAKSLQEQELNGSTSQHQQNHVGSSSNASSHSFNAPPSDGDIDTDTMSYEQLTQLGESIGAVNKGLSKRRIGQIPTHKFCTSRMKNLISEKTQCPICLVEFKQGDTLSTLPCAHIYHKECITLWLMQKKICCVCTTEIRP